MNLLGFVCVIVISAGVANANVICPDPIETCDPHFAPVCASDGSKTLQFVNVCYLSSENCNRLNAKDPLFEQAPCENVGRGMRPSCNDEVEDAVCARNKDGLLQTFDNSCQVGVANFDDGDIWRVISRGRC